MADFLAQTLQVALPYALFMDADVDDTDALFIPLLFVADPVAPTATLLSPLDGSVSRLEPIVFRVDDVFAIRETFLWVQYASGSTEMIYAPGVGFLSAFVGSTKSGDNPTTWTIKRLGGWLQAPRIYVQPVDGSGNVSVI